MCKMTIREAMSKVSADIKESAKAQHEIDKENFRKVKEQSAENFREATKPDPRFREFMAAEGIKEKAKTVARHLKDDSDSIRREKLQLGRRTR